jgi:hypothetical protein
LGIALYDFRGEQAGDLSLTEGETLVRAALNDCKMLLSNVLQY